MTPLEKAKYLIDGGTLNRNQLINDHEKVMEHLKSMKANCSKVINQLKKW